MRILSGLPKVSCYCSTYGRPNVLEESVESFLRQDYLGDKELVILNDFDKHTLFFDHPQVKIYNLPTRIPNLGRKFNENIKLCTGDILFPWEDDDIFFPNKLSYTVQNMHNDFFHVGVAFVEDGNRNLTVDRNAFHCNMAVAKPLWHKCGWYKEIDRGDIDIDILARLKTCSKYPGHKIPLDELFYCYRWQNTNSYHASGQQYTKSSGAVSDAATKFVDGQIAQGRVPVGNYTLKPFWKYDYLKAAEDCKARLRLGQKLKSLH